MSQPSTPHGSAPCNSSAGVTRGKDGEGEVEYNLPGVSQDRNEKLGYGELRHRFIYFFLNIGIWKLNKSSLVLIPLAGFTPMICDNPYLTHYPGYNLDNVLDEYSKTPAVGDHAPFAPAWPALNGCRSPKVYHPHPHRAEDPCRTPQSAPATPTAPLQSFMPELFLLLHPKGAGVTSPQDCRSWQAEKHGSSSAASSTQARAVPLAGNAWKHASLFGKLSCQINVKYTWVRSWYLSVVQLYPAHTAVTSGNGYSHEEKHGIPQLDLV